MQSQYRRLQAHLGNSADLFNGRLNAWVLSHVGTRQMAMAAQNGMAFEPAMNMQAPNTPFFAYQPQPQSPTSTLFPGMTQRNQSYRQSPYPQQYHRIPDQRSHSIASLQDQHLQQGMSDGDMHILQNQRRHSMVAPPDGQFVPGTPQPQGKTSHPPMSRTTLGAGMQPGHLGHSAFFNDQQFNNGMSPQFSFNGFPASTSSFDPMMSQMHTPISPLTTALPVEAQQVIGTSFDTGNQYTRMFMNPSHGQPIPPGINYTYRRNFGSLSIKQNSEGINQTLSPNPMPAAETNIDTDVDNLATPALTHNSVSSPDNLNTQYSAMGFDGSFGLGMNFDKTGGETTTTGTPNDVFFNDWVDTVTDEEVAQ